MKYGYGCYLLFTEMRAKPLKQETALFGAITLQPIRTRPAALVVALIVLGNLAPIFDLHHRIKKTPALAQFIFHILCQQP